MKGTLIMVTLLTLLAIPFSSAYAGCGMCSVGGSSHSAQAQTSDEAASINTEVVNENCPVMEGKVSKDTPFTTTYNGKVIGFCCEGCVKAFEADPQKYEANLDS